jgi:hypothetical protein
MVNIIMFSIILKILSSRVLKTITKICDTTQVVFKYLLKKLNNTLEKEKIE